MNIVVDASVALKLYVAEPDTEGARELFATEGSRIAPAHILGEIGEVLSRRCRDGTISRAQLNAASLDVSRSLSLLPLEDVFAAAFHVTAATTMSFYDALYVAAAELLQTVVVTADRRLVRIASGSPWAGHVSTLDNWLRARSHR